MAWSLQNVFHNAKGFAFVYVREFFFEKKKCFYCVIVIFYQRTRAIVTNLQSQHPQSMCGSSSHALLTAVP